MNLQEEIKKLEALGDLKKAYLNWHEEGGGEVICVNHDWYVLFDIPQYGGMPRLHKIYHKAELKELVEEAFSWT